MIAAGSVGALAGSGLMSAFDVETDWIVFLAAAAGAFLFALIAFVLALPIWIVLFSTAFAGATGVIAGVLLVFNQLDLEDFDRGAAWAVIEDSWFWLVVWMVIAVLGIAVQIRSIAEAALPDDRWTQGAVRTAERRGGLSAAASRNSSP